MLWRQILLAMTLVSLGACTSFPTINDDPAKNNQATFKKDAMDCAQSYPEAGGGAYVKQRIGCMNLKGWH